MVCTDTPGDWSACVRIKATSFLYRTESRAFWMYLFRGTEVAFPLRSRRDEVRTSLSQAAAATPYSRVTAATASSMASHWPPQDPNAVRSVKLPAAASMECMPWKRRQETLGGLTSTGIPASRWPKYGLQNDRENVSYGVSARLPVSRNRRKSRRSFHFP